MAPAGDPSTAFKEPRAEEQLPLASAERRLVSVLFADLVGFTPLSEDRDPEEVRELLTHYFDTARRIITRYGGTVEKFIGDAVMAVWGTPVASEDDAERAVRASLDLTAAVADIGAETGADLKARAGVVTGEAAVTLRAVGQGMVAGDVVNTASRLQSVAPPGTVLVDGPTHGASLAAVVYEDAGAFELKGKSEPFPAWHALRVAGGRKGIMRSTGLEAPFVGRNSEMRLVKELFHSTGEERRARLVSMVGVAGIGKSRFTWEFEKYIDGLIENIWWHRGRCLAYGEGVTFWAVAEMVRMRAGIAEEESQELAAEKLRAAIELHVSEEEERRWLEPRLAHLLGLQHRAATEQEDLFSGWRLFFERLAATQPVILVFEDLQWADPGLLDFIEYLLEWSRSYPLFVLTSSRPELADRRSSWGAGKRDFTPLYLEPLSETAMDELLCGLAPGLPDELRARVRERSEGIPLYAVETVRMLLDRRLLKKTDEGYKVVAEVTDLDVPESLHALIAARLDGLSIQERSLLQDASVLGQTFTRAGLVELTGRSDAEINDLLATLVRKELVTVQADPMSPERGQYTFIQALVQKVAYDTLALRDRKARHLAVASYLERNSGYDTEIVELVASHYLDAYQAGPNASDAGAIKEKARETLVGAGRRAASLASSAQAQRYYEQAAALAEDDKTRAELLERAGDMAWTGARAEEATAHYEAAIAVFEAEGRTHPAARVSARLAQIMHAKGQVGQAVPRLEQAFQVLSAEEPDEDLAMLAAELARLQWMTNELGSASAQIEIALEIAEALWLPEVVSQALNTKATIMVSAGRLEESLALLKHALQVAEENDLPSAALRAYNNLAYIFDLRDRYEDVEAYSRRGRELAHTVGHRVWELGFADGLSEALFAMGRWDELLVIADEIASARVIQVSWPLLVAQVHVHRGELEAARTFADLLSGGADDADIQFRAYAAAAKTLLLSCQGRHEEALAAALVTIEHGKSVGPGTGPFKVGYIEAVEQLFALDDLLGIEELLVMADELKPETVTRFTRAHSARFRARLAAARGHEDLVEPEFRSAADMLRELGNPFWLAVTMLEHGEWLVEQARESDAQSLFEEASATFERLRAGPWLERLEQAKGVTGRTLQAESAS